MQLQFLQVLEALVRVSSKGLQEVPAPPAEKNATSIARTKDLDRWITTADNNTGGGGSKAWRLIFNRRWGVVRRGRLHRHHMGHSDMASWLYEGSLRSFRRLSLAFVNGPPCPFLIGLV